MAHRVQEHISHFHLKVGECLFPQLKPPAALKAVARALKVMGVAGAQHMSWKAVRAGHATHMAANGSKLAAILEAGEWRSAAFLNCVDANIADSAEVLRSTLQNELDEDSEVDG